jgi:DNA polymerase-1
MEYYLVSDKPDQSNLFGDLKYKRACMEEVISYLDSVDEFAVDIETSWKYKGKYNYGFAGDWGKTTVNPNAEGLDPKLTDICMIQVGDLNEVFIIDARDHGVKWIKSYLENPHVKKIGQNLKFEYKHFKEHDIIMENMYDTMIAEKVLYTGWNLDWSLAGLIDRYVGDTVDKSTRLEFALIGDTPFSEKQILYGAEDITYPMKIRQSQLLDMKAKDVKRCFDLEMQFLPVLADIEYNGMCFNQTVWMQTYNTNLPLAVAAERALNAYVIERYSHTIFVDRQIDMFSDGFKCRVSWGSHVQVKKFFKFLGITPMDKNKMSLNGKVLMSYIKAEQMKFDPDLSEGEFGLLDKFLEYKGMAQATSTFGKKFLKYVHPATKRLYSNYNQVLNTGRISSSSPNLQNIPAKEGFRKAFDAPKGWKIVNADYSGQEQIILANKSQDPELQQFYKDGHSDMHSFIASKIYPQLANLSLEEIKEKHKDKRQIAKAAGFAINYGGTGYTIAKNLGISEADGDAVYDAYFKAFPNLKKYFDKVKRESLAQGYILIDPITRRKNWFKKPEGKRQRSAVERNALNYPIQGEAGGITKLAPILFRKWVISEGLQEEILLTNLVHDEINVEVKEEYAELAARNLERCMSEAADLWCKTIRLSADAVVTDYWNH